MTLEDYQRIIIEGEKNGLFQCLHEEEVVLVRNPLTQQVTSMCIRDVQVGDEIYTGNPTQAFARIVDIHRATKQGFKIQLPYGKSITATAEHRFPLVDGTLKTVEECRPGDTFYTNPIQCNTIDTVDAVRNILAAQKGHLFYLKGDEISKKYRKRTMRLDAIANDIDSIDYTQCVLSTERSPWTFPTYYPITTELMNLLGHYIGNGSKRSFVVSSEQTKMIECIQNALVIVFPAAKYNTTQHNNTTVIECTSRIPGRILDIVFGCRTHNQEKQLPNILFNVSDDMKRAFLQGYFCDGNFRTVTNDGHYADVTFNTSSKKLAYDLTMLLHSLNIGYTFRTEAGKDVAFSASDPRIIHRRQRFRLHIANLYELHKIPDIAAQHKNSAQLDAILQSTHQPRGLRTYKTEMAIQSIDEIGMVNVVDINVDTEDHLFVTTHGIVTHNCALGGRGDPDMHENFKEIIQFSAEHHIVPNFTTSGLGMTPEKAALCKQYCGAVAVSQYSRLADLVPELAVRRVKDPAKRKVYRSVDDIPVVWTFGDINPDAHWAGDQPGYTINGEHYDWDELHHMYYSDEPQEYEFYRVFNERLDSNTKVPNYTMKAVKMLLDAGVKTNIHFVLGNNTIDEAITRLKYGGFPKGINAVIFLLHKPVGLGKEDNVLQAGDPQVIEFFKLIDKGGFPFKVGFDSCTVPAILNYTRNIAPESIDSCEGGRYSMYITSDMKALPCSFDNQDMVWAYDISNDTIMNAWNSKQFNAFRSHFHNSCPSCPNRAACYGGCPIRRNTVVCDRDTKDLQ